MDTRLHCHVLHTGQEDHDKRLDRFLSERVEGHSRSELSRWIREGAVTVDDQRARASLRLSSGQVVRLEEPAAVPSPLAPEPIDLEIVHEDDDLVVLVKEAGMTVHPGPGVRRGTLVNALLARGERWSTIGGEYRPGIVHRLDRKTSGLMVVARTDAAHRHLSRQFRDRRVEKEYMALVWGRPEAARARIEGPIGRHRVQRARMAVRDDGRAAQTRYRIEHAFRELSLLAVQPLTGRTHQVRVHLAALGHPLVEDRAYGGTADARALPAGPLREALEAFGRTALHASRLAFAHPRDERALVFTAPLPDDFQRLLARLEDLEPRS